MHNIVHVKKKQLLKKKRKKQLLKCVVVVRLLSFVWLFATPRTAAHKAFLSFTISQSLLKFMSFELVMPSNHCISIPSPPPALNLSKHQGLFQWVSSATWGGQSIEALASATVLSVNIQGWFPLGLTGLILLLYKGLSRVFSSTTIRKHQFFKYK